MKPLAGLIRSRKFLLAMGDLVASVILYFVGKYASPSVAEDVKFIILAIQPVFLILIAAIAYEDGQQKRAGGYPGQ
jgi:hypothetical protein